MESGYISFVEIVPKSLRRSCRLSYPVPETWNVSGILSNNGVPFCQGKIEAYHKLADGTLDWMAECGIGEDGSFSLEFSSHMFQKGNTSIDHPDLVIRLFDFAGNLLWESDAYAATETPFELGKIDISRASADDVWSVDGFVFYNSVTPLGAGIVFVYDLWNGRSTLLAQASLNAKGYFACTYFKSAFQKQGVTRTAPDLQVVVRDLQGQSLATYEVPSPVSVHQVVRIRLNAVPGSLMSDDCRVFGNIKNPLGYPLQDDIEVAAFCLYYRESVDSAGAKIGTFEKAMLGNPAIPDTFGHYEIVYNASSIPQGLRLDSKIAKGKDKASLFAEVHYKNGGEGNDSPRSFYSAPLVFNGKSAQEINFVLDLETDKPIESEFERLDNVLKIYCQTVVSYKETIKVSCQDKISEFLDSVTRFPLVIGREDVDEAKTRAYFKSFQIAYELVDSVEGLRGALVSGITPISEEFQIVSVCAAYLYPLIRNAKVIDVSTLLATGLDECKKVIQEAISANLISSKLSADEFRLKIWNYLQKSKNVATEQENTFSAFFVFYLFLAKELELESNEFANAGSIKKNGKGGRPKLTRLGEHQERLDSLLDLFSDCGSSYQDLIASLKEDSSMFSSAEVEDLKFLIELGDFCNWYPDLVVSAYTLLHKENSPYKPCAKSDSLVSEEDLPGAWKLEYLLKYGDASGSEPNFWGEVIEKTAERYACWCREVALALPLDLFPGTTANEQKQIAIRTLKERLRAKFPQTELKLKLSEAFSADDSEKPWKDLVWKLQSEPWTDFDLNASDLEVFLKKSSAAHAQDDGIPEATASDDEKEKIRILQRLFRLTNNPQAIAYLVRNDFDSASKIALSDEENFVAKHGLGMGDKELATDIHRLAKNFVANATLDIERYHGNLNESDNTILSLPRGLQNESLSSQRARSLARNVRSVGNNVAKRRLQNKDYANWKTLFGSINRNSGTQNHTLHIVGRTRGEPHAYYYRRYEATALYGGNWTPWEEVPVEIDGAAIQPAILGGHLYITWLQVIQGQRQKKTGESGGKQAAVSVEYYAELRLKWTAFTGVKWTGVKVGKQAVYDVSENQLDFILGENESLAERYFVIDVSDNSDALSLQVWRTFPDFVDTPHVVTVPVANSAPMVGDVDGLDNAPATTYILKTEVSREYRADQRINHVGNFSLAQDGSDTASNQVEPNTGNPIAFTYGEFVKNHSPSGCRLVGNLFYNAGWFSGFAGRNQNFWQYARPVQAAVREHGIYLPRGQAVLLYGFQGSLPCPHRFRRRRVGGEQHPELPRGDGFQSSSGRVPQAFSAGRT